MFGSKSNSPMDKILDDAQAIVAERAKLLESIQVAESRLAEANERIRAAGERVAAEEFEAAQREGGLAIASKAAQQGVAEAELKAKSARLKLQGLRSQREKIAADLVPACEALTAYRDEVFRQRAAEVSDEFDAAIDKVRSLICTALALAHHAGGGFGERYGYRVFWFQTLVFNPLLGKKTRIGQGIFQDQVGNARDLDKEWRRDPKASDVYEAIKRIDDQIAPIAAVVAEDGPN